MSSNITAHMIVKNEDRWIWFAITSILPYVDKILIIDTGSTDNTIECINSIKSAKISLSKIMITSPAELTALRNEQINQTKTDWIWIVDGDEIYTNKCAEEIVSAVSQNYHGVVARRYDLMGDIYHKQDERVGEYRLLGNRGHLLVRLINIKHFDGIHVAKPYPLEAYLDKNEAIVHSYNQNKWYITSNYLYHAMYLKRSSLGSNLPMFNRGKYKIETGIEINDSLPEVFRLKYPGFVPNPLQSRGVGYEMLAKLITPIKKLKRKII